MKKIIALLLALVMVMGMVACGAKEEAPAVEEEKVEAPAEEKEEAPAEEEEAPAEEEEAPAEEEAPVEETLFDGAPVEEAPVEDFKSEDN